MELVTKNDGCGTCPGRVVCRCVQVTEEVLVSAIQALELRTVRDIRDRTGAGDGCTCCHKLLKRYLEARPQSEPSLEPI